MIILTSVKEFIQEIIAVWGNERPARLAAALAYYGMFSLAPMLFIAITVADIFVDTLAMSDQMFEQLSRTLGPETAEFIQSMVISASERAQSSNPISTLIGLGALLYASTGLFAHLKYSLNAIWDVPMERQSGMMHYVKTRLLAFVLVLGIALILVVVTFFSVFTSILTTLLNYSGQTIFGNNVIFVLTLAVSFAILYRILPDEEVLWRDVWLGALITAGVFGVGRWGIGIYFRYSSVTTAFEAAGALAILLIAIYYAAQVFLLGAIFSKIYATRYGSKAKQTVDENV